MKVEAMVIYKKKNAKYKRCYTAEHGNFTPLPKNISILIRAQQC